MDTVKVELGAATKESKRIDTVRVVVSVDDVRNSVTAVPADEWTEIRRKVMEHYNIAESTRIDCTNIITALTIALEGR